jgi:CHAT domain-containing protein/Tfp pilus assembly protein PilF
VAAAEEYYQRALGLRRNLPDRRDVAGSLNGLGNVARAQGDLAKAKGYYEQALAIAATSAPDSLDVARTLSNLGAVAEGQGDLVLAADYQQRALAIRQRLVPGSLLVAETLSNFAKIASDQGDLPEAERYHRRSLSIRENQSPESLLVATSLNDLGAMARAHADVAKAAAYYEQALVLREKLAPRSLTVAESLYSLSDLALQLGNRIEAERWAGQAWGLVRQQATVVNGDEARQAFDRSTARYAAQLIRCQLALGETRAAFTTLEQSRAQALQQLIADRRFIAGLTDDGRWRIYRSALLARDRHEYDLSRAVAAEAQARQELANLDSQQASGDPVTRAVSHLREAAGRVQQEQSDYTLARVRADELWADIKDRASPASAPPLSFTQAQIVVPPGAVFVAFDTAAEQIHLFVLRRGATDRALLSVYTLDLSPEQLERRVRDFHDCVARPLWGYQCVRLARQLYNGLFPIPARHLMANAARIIISPDGPLWDVPFAALVVNAAGAPEYLGEQKPITYATSLTCFAQSRSELPRLPVGMAPRALVVGQTRGLLPYSRREAEQVAALYGSHPLTGAAATETTVRARIGGADVIHLATHSLSLPLPMSSGIVLAESGRAAPGDDSSEDGLLQAWEIQSQLKLRAELVVLSACNTGAGQVVPEEGIIGLTRALQYAGARSIVASKWEAEDRSTATLMVAFHGYLRQGLAKDEALRRAMSNVRRHPGTARPYYWASFFLLGDPDNPSLGVGRCPDECSG